MMRIGDLKEMVARYGDDVVVVLDTISIGAPVGLRNGFGKTRGSRVISEFAERLEFFGDLNWLSEDEEVSMAVQIGPSE